MSRTIPPQYVHGAGAGVLVLAGIAFMYFQAGPVVAARAHLRELNSELATRKESLVQAQVSRKDTEARVAAMRAQLKERLLPLVPTSRLNERLEQLSQLAEASGMTVDRLSPAEAATKGPFPAVQLKLVGQGPYEACERLIGTLHGSFEDTAITSLHVKGTPENAGAPVSLDLELLWYTAADAPGAK